MTFDDIGDLNPWDAGKLRAHQLSAYCSTAILERRLKRARCRRRGWLCWILGRRKAFLEGLIEGLQLELKRRERDGHGHAH